MVSGVCFRDVTLAHWVTHSVGGYSGPQGRPLRGLGYPPHSLCSFGCICTSEPYSVEQVHRLVEGTAMRYTKVTSFYNVKAAVSFGNHLTLSIFRFKNVSLD